MNDCFVQLGANVSTATGRPRKDTGSLRRWICASHKRQQGGIYAKIAFIVKTVPTTNTHKYEEQPWVHHRMPETWQTT